MGVVGRLDQYASILASEFDEYSMSENLVSHSGIPSSIWAVGGVITYNSATSPDGTVNAIQFSTSFSGDGAYLPISLAAGVYTYSLFVKAVSGSNTIYFGSNNATIARVAVNVFTGATSIHGGSPTNITSVPYLNNWYRVSFTFTAGNGTHTFVIFNETATANTWLVYGPQIEKGSVATDYTPTTGTAINRVLPQTTNTNISGTGTYYASVFDENTNIIRSVETGENLITYSGIPSSNWNANNSAVLTNNSSTSPDGTVNATQIAAAATAGSGTFAFTFTLSSGNVYTCSLFVKAVSGSNTIYFGSGTTNATVQVNTSTGVAVSNSGASATNITSIPYPNSWYRISFTFTATSTASHSFIIYNFTSSANTWLAWGAQVERGSVATDYTPTTTTYRFASLPLSTFALSANAFAPYDPVYDEFGGTSFGAGQGRYMRQSTDKSVIVYNEIDEITDFRDIVTTGLVLDLDAGMNSSFNNTGGTTWTDLTNSRSSIEAVNQQAYTTAGTYTFTVPAGCTSISAVVVGGGGGGAGCDGNQVRGETNNGGGGGGLAYGTIAVTPGESLTITVGAGGPAGGDDTDGTAGGTSTIVKLGITLLLGGGGGGGVNRSGSPAVTSAGGASGGTRRIGGGSGGSSGTGSSASGATGGGGAGGYSGNGGDGGARSAAGSASTGAGGGGGGGFGGSSDTLRAGGGGGVGIRGTGSNGSAGVINGGGGGGGSALTSITEGTSGGGNTSGLGGTYGGGGGGKADCFNANGTATPNGGAGTNGAVRIVWGTGRSYPSTGLTDFTPVVGYDNASHTAQLINAPTYSSANGGYLVFNGTNQYVTSIFRTTSGQAVTYAGWLYSTETTATYRNFVDSVSANPMIWWNTSGQIEFDSALYTTTTVYRNQWVYVALSKPSGSSSASYYVNGVLVGTGSAYTTPAATPTWFNRAAAQTWKGNAANVQAYNRALSAAEILQNYNALKNRFGL